MKPRALVGIFGAAFLALLTSAPSALAQTFDFTFTDVVDGVNATGVFTESGGVATAGIVTVSGPANFLNGTLTLAALTNPVGQTSTVRDVSGDDEIFDNLVAPTSDPVFNSNGLGFVSSTTYPPGYIVNLWGNGPGSYSLYEAGNDGQGPIYQIVDGSLSLTEIPEPSAYAASLCAAALVFAAVRRRFRVA